MSGGCPDRESCASDGPGGGVPAASFGKSVKYPLYRIFPFRQSAPEDGTAVPAVCHRRWNRADPAVCRDDGTGLERLERRSSFRAFSDGLGADRPRSARFRSPAPARSGQSCPPGGQCLDPFCPLGGQRFDLFVRPGPTVPDPRFSCPKESLPMTDRLPGFDTLAIHAGRRARRGDRRPGDADLPDDVLRVRRRRPCGLAVRPAGVRQHLLAHRQPDLRRAGGAGRGARGRHGGARGRVRPRGASSWSSTR